MLEKVWVQIFVKSIFEFNITLFPIDLIAERYMHTLYQLHFVFTSQVDIHYLFTIVSYVKFFMCPDMIRDNAIVFLRFSYNTYNIKTT